MTEKEIYKFFHLYGEVDCLINGTVFGKVRSVYRENKYLESKYIAEVKYLGSYVKYNIREIKIGLRPISDLKEHEAFELAKLLYTGSIVDTPVFNSLGYWVVSYGKHLENYWIIDGSVFNQHQTIYLLRNKFDLLGLIEIGIAYDKTNL